MEASLTALLNIVEGTARTQRSDAAAAQAGSGLTDSEWWAIVAPALDYVMGDEAFPVSGRVGNAAGTAFDASRDPQRSLRVGVTIALGGIEELLRSSNSTSGGPTPEAG